MLRANIVLILAALTAPALYSRGAAAEEPTNEGASSTSASTVAPIKIIGRRRVPLSITVARVEPKLGPNALQRTHIQRAAAEEPF